MAVNVAIGQVFILSLENSPFIQGFYQGCYGIGAIVGPLIANTLVSHGVRWSRFFWLTLGVAIANLIFAGWSFWQYERDIASGLLLGVERISSRQQVQGTCVATRWETIKRSLCNRTTLLGGFFIFAYQGAEVSISGWVISFLKIYRNASDAFTGYVTVGFWVGIAFGRFGFTSLGHRIGERMFVFVVTVVALLLQLVIWFVPSLPACAAAVVFSGLALGPISPSVSFVLGELIPRQMHVLSFSFITSIGSSGGAMAPFLTGVLAEHVGIFVLHPICVGLFVMMVVCWFFLPRLHGRSR